MYISVISFCIIISVCGAELISFNSDEARLIYNLFTKKNYDPAVRPVKKYSSPINLHVGLQITSIVDLDIKDEILVANVWLTMVWKDEFLSWDPEEFGGVTTVNLPSDRVWKPDLKLINDVMDRKDELPKPNVVLSNDGDIIYVPPKQLRSECDLDVQYFPFDTQECQMTFITWTYDAERVNMSMLNDQTEQEIDDMLVDQFRPGVYNITKGQFRNICNTYTWGDNGTTTTHTYCKLVATIQISRQRLHYVYTVIVPSALISLLSLLVFRLSPESGEKISLGVTLLLVFHVLLWSLGEKMPESANTIPLLAVYLSCIMAMTSICIVMTVLVLNLHGKGSVKPVPHWVRYLILDKLAALLHLKRARRFRKQNDMKRQEIGIAADQLMEELTIDHPKETDSDKVPLLQDKTGDITKLLRLLVLKSELEKGENDTAEEWRAVALVIDRMLFWIFSLFTVVISVYMLIVIPLTH